MKQVFKIVIFKKCTCGNNCGSYTVHWVDWSDASFGDITDDIFEATEFSTYPECEAVIQKLDEANNAVGDEKLDLLYKIEKFYK